MDTPRPDKPSSPNGTDRPPNGEEPSSGNVQRSLVLAATTCAMVVLASQLAGKAARDAIFLQRFSVTNMPLLLAVSSALAIVTTFIFARRMQRGIPVRVVQIANVISALLLVVEWLLLDHFPRPVATIIFMHQTLLGPILVSGFWSVMSECFDPRTARRVLGTVGTGATIGAVLGAVLSERVAAMFGTNALLPTIAILQVLAMWRLSRIKHSYPPLVEGEEQPLLKEAIENIAKISLLRRLAIITVIVTVAAALLDYLFKAGATAVVSKPDDLARLFAMFHGVVGICTALLQWVLGRWALQHLGLARTLATLPGAVIVFGIIAVILPGIGTYVALRGAENVLRNSLYREAYEVFYTPLIAAERRATKTIIDVGVERLGDVVGGLSVMGIIAFAPFVEPTLLLGAVALSAIGVIVALQVQRSYVEALERSLLAQAIDLESDDPHDRTTRATLELVAGKYPTPDASERQTDDSSAGDSQRRTAPERWSRFRKREPRRGPLDLKRLGELASNDPKRIRRALCECPLSPAGLAYAIALLERENIAEDAARAIAGVAGSSIGQLVDAVGDRQLPTVCRARLPRVIAEAADSRHRAEVASAGLTACLVRDSDFAIRCQIAGALARIHERYPELGFDEAMVFDGVRRELESKDPVTTEHLATLLALALPAEPIRTAFHSLKSEDPGLRGVALEYLENVLPGDIRERMWIVLAIEVPTAIEKRPLEAVLAELLRPDVHTTQIDLPAARA